MDTIKWVTCRRGLITQVLFIAGLLTAICCGGGSGGVGTTSTTSTTSTTAGSDLGALRVGFSWPTSDPSKVLNFCDKVRVLCVDSGGVTRERIMSRADGASTTFSALPIGSYRATLQGYVSATTQPIVGGATFLASVTKDTTTDVTLVPLSAITQVNAASSGTVLTGTIDVPIGTSVPVTLVAKDNTSAVIPLPLAAFKLTSSNAAIANTSTTTQITGSAVGSATVKASTTLGSAQSSFTVHVPGAGGGVIIK